MARVRYRGLDGLRGVAALTVVLFHCNGFFHEGAFFQHGYLAVDAFMMLSGFVIALTYEHQFKAGLTLSTFLYRRARRLMPTYWIGAFLGILIFWFLTTNGLAFAGYSPTQIWLEIPLFTMLMVPMVWTGGQDIFPALLNIPWSLVAEWFANVFYAAGIYRLRTRTLGAFVVCGWAAMTVAGYFSGVGWCTGTSADNLFTIGLLRCLPSFWAGVFIFRVHKHALFDRLPIISTEILLAVWLAIGALPAFTATPTLDAILVTMCTPLLICLLIRSEHKAPEFGKVLGEVSYPLYVVHGPILLLFYVMPFVGAHQGPNPLGGILAIGCTIVVAWVIAKTVPRLPQISPLALMQKPDPAPRPTSIS